MGLGRSGGFKQILTLPLPRAAAGLVVIISVLRWQTIYSKAGEGESEPGAALG